MNSPERGRCVGRAAEMNESSSSPSLHLLPLSLLLLLHIHELREWASCRPLHGRFQCG